MFEENNFIIEYVNSIYPYTRKSKDRKIERSKDRKTFASFSTSFIFIDLLKFPLDYKKTRGEITFNDNWLLLLFFDIDNVRVD